MDLFEFGAIITKNGQRSLPSIVGQAISKTGSADGGLFNIYRCMHCNSNCIAIACVACLGISCCWAKFIIVVRKCKTVRNGCICIELSFLCSPCCSRVNNSLQDTGVLAEKTQTSRRYPRVFQVWRNEAEMKELLCIVFCITMTN